DAVSVSDELIMFSKERVAQMMC
ncbi:hypothetical protein KT99_10328, partial [Shewanella benthica KT99]